MASRSMKMRAKKVGAIKDKMYVLNLLLTLKKQKKVLIFTLFR